MKQSKYNPFILEDCDIVKLIEGHNSKLDLSTLDKLSCYAFKLLIYIIQNLESDYIYLQWTSIKKELGYGTYVTFHKAIGELEGACLIKRKGRNEYWTNPLHLFKTKTDEESMSKYYMETFKDGMKKYAPKVYFDKYDQIKKHSELKNELKVNNKV